MVGEQSLFVDAVAGFVQDAEQPLVQLARVVARREPAISRTHAAAKGVSGRVEAAGGKVKANGCCRRLTEQMLTLDRIVASPDIAARPADGRGDGSHQRRQVLAQGAEQLR